MMYKVVKRVFDIAFAMFGLLLSSPLWFIAIIGILLSDPGPIFYLANRVGKDNRVFKMFKFRSMRQGRANESTFRGDENRIFAFGKFIRATKIDELPQLLNILCGSMSVVGPRPASVDQVSIVRAGKYQITAQVPAGLTGPSALYDYLYGDTVTDEEAYTSKVLPTRLELDVYYVQHRSVAYDLKMIWYTAICVAASIFHKVPKRILTELTSSVQRIVENKEKAESV